MRRTLAALVLFLGFTTFAAAQVQTWRIDPGHSNPQFAVKHFGISTVRGSFQKVSGTVQYDPSDISKTVVEATIETASVNTGNESRDKDLRGPNYFDVEKFPTITFKSKRAESEGQGTIKLTGDLTIKGVTKEVTLTVQGPTVVEMRGNKRMGAEATTKIKRSDFGVSGGAAVVGDEIQITIDVELVPQQPAPQNK
jgi:polyisoprenoid-binding protein YceI